MKDKIGAWAGFVCLVLLLLAISTNLISQIVATVIVNAWHLAGIYSGTWSLLAIISINIRLLPWVMAIIFGNPVEDEVEYLTPIEEKVINALVGRVDADIPKKVSAHKEFQGHMSTGVIVMCFSICTLTISAIVNRDHPVAPVSPLSPLFSTMAAFGSDLLAALAWLWLGAQMYNQLVRRKIWRAATEAKIAREAREAAAAGNRPGGPPAGPPAGSPAGPPAGGESLNS